MKKIINLIKTKAMMFREYTIVVVIGTSSLLYCMICLIFKCVPSINVPFEWMRILGDFMLNIAISVIAAVIFFVFQVVIPNNAKHHIMRRLMYSNIQEGIVIHLKGLVMDIELYKSLSELSELLNVPDTNKAKQKDNLNATIKARLQLIKDNIDNSIISFYDYLPDNVLMILEKIKHSSIMDRVTLYDDFSNLDQRYREIEPLIDSLAEFYLSEDAEMVLRSSLLRVHHYAKECRNTIQIIAETAKLYDQEKTQQK